MKALLPPRIAVVAALAFLAACSEQELYSKLSERQANEMVAVLRAAGIEADKLSKEGAFSVVTPPDDFPQAVRTLSAQGYPREEFDSMGKIFKREGFVSSPLEERARLVHALSQEISNTIANIDGVVSARVHLVVPERNPLADKPRPAAASVFIKHRPDKDFASQVAQIKALVVNSIEGLPYDNVTVALFPAESLPLPAPAAPAAPMPGMAPTPLMALAGIGGLDLPLMMGTAAGGLLAFGGAVLWWRRRSGRPHDEDATLPPPALSRAAPQSLQVRSREELQAALRRAAEQR
jgi:type III secretion protein J